MDPAPEKRLGLAAVFAPATAFAAVATAVATVSAATTTTTASAGTVFAWTRFINGQCAAINGFAVQSAGCGIRAFFGFHGDKCEAARAAGEFVHDHIHFKDVAVWGEHILKLVFRGVEGKISHKQFRTHDDNYLANFDSPLVTVPDHRVSNHH
jgi:hypothetical protein